LSTYNLPRGCCVCIYREELFKSEKDKEEFKKMFSNPVVFAVCVVEAGRKLVDYYMTWRGMVVSVMVLVSAKVDSWRTMLQRTKDLRGVWRTIYLALHVLNLFDGDRAQPKSRLVR
jgi:hypothetical protein